jgi:hypothetical protein
MITGLIRLAAAGTLAALMLFGLASSRGDDDFKVEEGFTSLFNGKDLSGWRVGKEVLDGMTENANRRFQVVGGTIVANEKDANGKGGILDLYTTRDFNTDFTLRLEFRAAPRADSGVYIRGKQLQVRDYPTVGPYKKVKFKGGDWNDLEIIVKGEMAECRCNGEVIEPAFKVPAKGGIGLQAEAGKFEFRRIRVKSKDEG